MIKVRQFPSTAPQNRCGVGVLFGLSSLST
jgi:hypothetical protein